MAGPAAPGALQLEIKVPPSDRANRCTRLRPHLPPTAAHHRRRRLQVAAVHGGTRYEIGPLGSGQEADLVCAVLRGQEPSRS